MAVRRHLDIGQELLEGFDRSARVTEYLVGILPSDLWRADPPTGRGRTIAAVVAHVQGVRRTFAKMGGAQPAPPALDRLRATPAEALRALQQSREALTTLFGGAIDRGEGRIKRMPRRTIDMLLYIVQHDAHHRGQISMLARAMGHQFTAGDMTRIWGWRKL